MDEPDDLLVLYYIWATLHFTRDLLARVGNLFNIWYTHIDTYRLIEPQILEPTP